MEKPTVPNSTTLPPAQLSGCHQRAEGRHMTWVWGCVEQGVGGREERPSDAITPPPPGSPQGIFRLVYKECQRDTLH